MHENRLMQPPLRAPAQSGDVAPASQRRAILVLGMHRSGTSAVSGVIDALGVTGPRNLAPPTEWNPRGFFESPRIFGALDELLAAAGSRWDDWRQLDRQRFDAAAERQRPRLARLFAAEFGGAPLIYLKDPRLCRFVPFAAAILAELGYATVAVLPVRKPLEVAYSLQRREKFALSKSVLIWLRHVLDAEFDTRDMPRCFVCYEDLLVDWRRQMQRVAAQTGLRWPDESEKVQAAIDGFLSADLNHERASAAAAEQCAAVAPAAATTYEILLEIINSGDSKALRDRLDALRDRFNDACRTFAPAVAEVETANASLAADCDRLASECAALRAKRDLTVENVLTHKRDPLEIELDRLAEDNKKLAAGRDALLAATGWRMTAPLRALKELAARSRQWFGRGGQDGGW